MRFRGPVLQGIQHIVLKQLLVGDPHFHRLPSRTMLPIPEKTSPPELGPSLLPAALLKAVRPPSWSLSFCTSTTICPPDPKVDALPVLDKRNV